MRLTVISRNWPSLERSGVTLAAAEHVRMFAEAGHQVNIVGSHVSVSTEPLPVNRAYFVNSKGSAALYSQKILDVDALTKALVDSKPDLVVCEAWQTSLTDGAVQIASKLGLRVMMVSHGVSIHPFTNKPKDLTRAIGWSSYGLFKLPRLVKSLNVLTALDLVSRSKRFYDRDLASKFSIPVLPLVNAAINLGTGFVPYQNRNKKILVVGYFSPVKNQFLAIDILRHLPRNISIQFVGRREGVYYEKCVKRVAQFGLADRVVFSEDHECDLSRLIAESSALLSTSITEALPINLLEAMAVGTPFVATPVGAVPSLLGGVVADGEDALSAALKSVIEDEIYWSTLSEIGRKNYASSFSRPRVKEQLMRASAVALS